jgi:Xaa-Pro aminopeptidase
MNYIYKDENAIYYKCGYSCDNAIFVSFQDDKFFITDSRYEIDVKENTKDIQIIISKDLLKSLCELIQKNNIKKININPREWSYFEISKIKEYTSCISKHNMSMQERIIKTDKEIDIIKKAVKLGEDGFLNFVKYLQQNGINKTEKQLSLQNYISMSNEGDLDTSFDAIIAINENSAKPHATPTTKKLSLNDTLLVDAGIKYKRYCSDRTRTISFDKNSLFEYKQRFNDTKKQNIYDTVLKAHHCAIENFKYGMRACDIDNICRDIIYKAGYGKYFVHSTGHGVGLDIHEFPFISSKDDTMIEDNMIFTIEPGIYISDFIGVRIEDMVVVKNGKLEIL